MNIDYLEKIRSVLFGTAIGDALGVPVEFKNRGALKNNEVTDMIGYGTHHVPAGTFSDDSSMAFCLAEALTGNFELKKVGRNFVEWAYSGYWTATGEVFDIGITTQQAIERLAEGEKAERAGSATEDANGNGSLMRISPLLFYLEDKDVDARFGIIRKVSAITHGHIRSVIACFYYLEFARMLLAGNSKLTAYSQLRSDVGDYLRKINVSTSEIDLFGRLLTGDIFELEEEDVQSSGYVLHTLEASIWCLMTTNSFREAVLKAVNLGGDTDTTAAVTGGLAGLLYGYEQIPESWLKVLARREDIDDLAQRLFANLYGNSRTSPGNKVTLPVLVKTRMQDLGLTKKDVVLGIGYINLTGGSRVLTEILNGEQPAGEQYLALANALALDPDVVIDAMIESRIEEERVERAYLKSRFKPYICAMCERSIPSPIFAGCHSYPSRFIHIENSFLQRPVSDQLAKVKESICNHFSRMKGRILAFGEITHYVYRRDFDEPRSEMLIFDTEGNLIDDTDVKLRRDPGAPGLSRMSPRGVAALRALKTQR